MSGLVTKITIQSRPILSKGISNIRLSVCKNVVSSANLRAVAVRAFSLTSSNLVARNTNSNATKGRAGKSAGVTRKSSQTKRASKAKKPQMAKKPKKVKKAKKPKAKKVKKLGVGRTKRAPTKAAIREAKINRKTALLRPPSSRAITPYVAFVIEFFKQQTGSVKKNMQDAAQSWKSLTDAQKHEYIAKAKEENARRKEEAEKWWATTDIDLVKLENSRRRRRNVTLKSEKKSELRLLDDPRLPKRPATSFSLFFADRFASVKSDKSKKVTDHFKDIATQWRALPESEKQKYKDIFAKNKKEYEEGVKKLLHKSD
ncbi:hypothetical protein AX774_g2755 [Zancudomyces culisetae]|uniref:HMG box domain-containing protein n=1 Tax=Zancudomyces culisetae TaxID=1213189 RepID=A0A1R1PS12_ZANCU|nr:hypothetical protein AX774_g2755 [Zancudomyces culisetae]|eukprot:OMH83741.1 hypothetical protein AX774_g2755 [Zancudomyces culisetae]